MTRPKSDRNLSLRERRARDRISIRELAREHRISPVRVQQILDETGGDPLRLARVADLERASEKDLLWERGRLELRIGADLRRLLAIDDELNVWRTDRLLNLSR